MTNPFHFIKVLLGFAGAVLTGAVQVSGEKASPLAESNLPKARLAEFRSDLEPVLKRVCVSCHGPAEQKGKFRVDTLNPDLLKGKDVSWWLEVFDVIGNGEMPPEDAKAQLTNDEKALVVDWLSNEIQTASQVRRSEKGHTPFRRMTRYEYKYAMQDLLGLPHDFSRDLPPETSSEDGFKNSSEMLQMTAVQFGEYRAQARRALELATVRGDRPNPIYYGITMKAASAKVDSNYAAYVEKKRKRMEKGVTTPDEATKKQEAKYGLKSGNTQFRNTITGNGVRSQWSYHGAKYAWKPTSKRPEIPSISSDVVVIPANQKFIIDLGDGLPDTGNMRVRIRATRLEKESHHLPTVRLYFGHQPSNDSRISENVGGPDLRIDAPPGNARFYEWDVALDDAPRNSFRKTHKLGQTPNPAEFLSLKNTSGAQVSLVIDYIEIIAPAFHQWPPRSHRWIFADNRKGEDEKTYARKVISLFMARAWRRPVREAEVDQKMKLFDILRPQCEDSEEATLEVLASVISSPKFLYLVRADGKKNQKTSDFELASRLSFFLWSSRPDEELMGLAKKGKLSDPKVLEQQTRRLLNDPKSQRFARHFTRQWLGMDQLDFLKFDTKAYGKVDPLLVEAMKSEPVALFAEMLKNNEPVMDFIHSDYILANHRLAQHYGLPEVSGIQMRKVGLPPESKRGGLLGQAGLLAMNSNGKDSNPLKRGVWLLENLLNDPPPPPPPAVPEIDLADPEILKLSLKERMEDHRNDPACFSCHAKIDPWGIAFENFDALGRWRDKIADTPVDASSLLYNKDELHGMEGVKEYLMANRQDQFTRAMAHKLSTYALGRPLSFGDRSEVDRIAADLRKQGDGLTDLVILVVKSELFRLN